MQRRRRGGVVSRRSGRHCGRSRRRAGRTVEAEGQTASEQQLKPKWVGRPLGPGEAVGLAELLHRDGPPGSP